MREVPESLAGRLALVELSPFLAVRARAPRAGSLVVDRWIPDGGVLGGRRFPHWQLDYVRLLAERDLPAWGLAARPSSRAG